MKTKIIIVILFVINIKTFSQNWNGPVYAEVVDTIKIAYDIYDAPMIMEGFYTSPDIIIDSIGLDSVRIIKLYITVDEKKLYIEYELTNNLTKYLTKPKGKNKRIKHNYL